jgi:hypothetical protein
MIQLESKGGWVARKPGIKLSVGSVRLVVITIIEEILDVPETKLEAARTSAFRRRRGPVADKRDKDEKEENRDNQGDGRLAARHKKSFPENPGEGTQDGNPSGPRQYTGTEVQDRREVVDWRSLAIAGSAERNCLTGRIP